MGFRALSLRAVAVRWWSVLVLGRTRSLPNQRGCVTTDGVVAASYDGSALVGAPWMGGAKQASAVDRRYCHMGQWVDSVDRRHCHMGQCVDPLAMLPGRWDLVRTIEIKPLVRTRIGRLQADGAW